MISVLVLASTCPSSASSIVEWGDGRFTTAGSGSDFIAVDGGYDDILGLKSDGTVVEWGYLTPPSGEFAAIAAGYWHMLALRPDGSIVSWGADTNGSVSNTPSGNDFVAIDGGGYHSVALRYNGSLVSWGGWFSPLNGVVNYPTPSGSDFVAISAGQNHNVALKNDGSIVVWGNNDYGQHNSPSGNDFVAAGAGYFHCLALKSDGSIVSWGADNEGVVSNTPSGSDFIAINTGLFHSLALRSDGSIVAWGSDYEGQVSGTPTGGGFVGIATGRYKSFALLGDSPPTNAPPVANAGPDQTVEATSPDGASVTLDGSDSSDDGQIQALTYTWDWSGDPATGVNPVVTLPLGTTTVTLTVYDGELSASDTVDITVSDTTPPTIVLNGDATIKLECGIDEYAELGATASDICDTAVVVLIDSSAVDTSTCGTYIVTYDATDASSNAAVQVQRTVVVEDTIPPEISINAPQLYGLYAVGDLALDFAVSDLGSGSVVVLAELTDPSSYSKEVYPGDIVQEAGVYTLRVGATDAEGNSSESEVFFVVYDPTGGFVTGGGWIDSPEGAYKPDTSMTGKANFGFVSKYKKGASVPIGNTEFNFKTGNLNFHSSSYEWLVVTGSDYARFKGWGAINGEGSYRFMLWAGDSPDTFRIKIWWEDGETENVIYDNGMDQSIGRGSIVIHTK